MLHAALWSVTSYLTDCLLSFSGMVSTFGYMVFDILIHRIYVCRMIALRGANQQIVRVFFAHLQTILYLCMLNFSEDKTG